MTKILLPLACVLAVIGLAFAVYGVGAGCAAILAAWLGAWGGASAAS